MSRGSIGQAGSARIVDFLRGPRAFGAWAAKCRAACSWWAAHLVCARRDNHSPTPMINTSGKTEIKICTPAGSLFAVHVDLSRRVRAERQQDRDPPARGPCCGRSVSLCPSTSVGRFEFAEHVLTAQ